jgi:hypothetical protein
MDLHRLLSAVARGVAAAAVWGVLAAAITRVLMRVVTLLTRGTPDFTWSGTLSIAVLSVAALTPGAIALAYSPSRWSWLLFGGGVAFLAYGAVGIGVDETSHAQGLSAWRWAGLIAVLLTMLTVYTAQVLLVHRSVRTSGRSSAARDRQVRSEPASREVDDVTSPRAPSAR